MFSKKKEQSSCTSPPRRVLESLSVKEIAKARADCFPNSWKGSLSSRKASLNSRKGLVSPTLSGEHVTDRDDCNQNVYHTSHRMGSVSHSGSDQHLSDRDDCNLGVYRSSHNQWPESCGTRPQSRKQSKTCVPLCSEVSAMFEEIQHCRDAIGALAQEAQSIISAASGLLDDCVCKKPDQTNKKHKKVKKVNSKVCCQQAATKKGSYKDTCCLPSWINNCVCDEAETKKRNKPKKVQPTESKHSCQKICGKKSSHIDFDGDYTCYEKKKMQNQKVTTADSKTCYQRKIDKESCCVCAAPKDLDDCFCAETQQKVQKTVNDCSCQKKIEKETSDKSTCCVPPITADDCACDAEMKKRNKNMQKTCKNCCHQTAEKKSSDKHTCCIPPVVADDCACDAEMKKRNKKVKKTDCKSCCEKTAEKKGSDKETCCVPPVVADDCGCEAEMKKRNKKVKKTDCKSCCEKPAEKKGSDKETCYMPPVVADDCAHDAEMNKNCCHKISRKKNTEKDSCCFSVVPKELDDCGYEERMKKQSNKVIISDSKNSCQKVIREKASNKDTCCVRQAVINDWTGEGAEEKMQSATKNKSASAPMSYGIPSSAENSCTCRFPPAYRQYFDCTGQISGSCQCDKNN